MSEKLSHEGGFEYRYATLDDLGKIVDFVDLLLSKGDCFVSTGRHIDYIRSYEVLLTFAERELIGWAVKQKDGTLIHLLVDTKYRCIGVGATMLRKLSPPRVRSKCDQSSGNPIGFYRKLGYVKLFRHPIGKNKNIEVLVAKKSEGLKEGC